MCDLNSKNYTESTTVHELLERSAESMLEIQRNDGSFPPGQNYTYGEPETPVRTTSHCAVIIAKVYNNTQKNKFKMAANSAVDYLLSSDIRPNGYTYHCRDVEKKDRCNGLVGQATPIRALGKAGSILGRQDALKTAETVFNLHPFDRNLNIWEIVEIDGTKLSFDRTLNHQIIFAAAGSTLARDFPDINKKIILFLDSLAENMSLHQNGLIKHYIRPPVLQILETITKNPRYWNLLLNEIVFHYYSYSKERKKKELAYHPTNIRALSKLKLEFPQHKIWGNEKMQKAVNFGSLTEFKSEKYGSVIPGICLALRQYAFYEDDSAISKWVTYDISDNINLDTYLLESETVDDMDKSSMLSHLADLPNISICI